MATIKSLKIAYDKAVKKEQTLSSLLLANLEKYKAAKAKGDEKGIARHTKIAGDLGKKKRKATTDASAAYKAYEDKISGLHSDAELELSEIGVTENYFRQYIRDVIFEEIKKKTGLSEKEVILIMRKNLKRKSYLLWRKRVRGRVTKHRKLFKSKFLT